MASEWQVWSDAVAMALALRSQESTDTIYAQLMEKYSEGDEYVDAPLFDAAITILGSLLDAAADYFELTPDELGNYILMEKFKKDMNGG